jgi:hypothetical protein
VSYTRDGAERKRRAAITLIVDFALGQIPLSYSYRRSSKCNCTDVIIKESTY